MKTHWTMLGIVHLLAVTNAAVGDHCCQPRQYSRACAAPQSTSATYSQPSAYSSPVIYSQPVTYSQASTYSAPTVYSQPVSYSVPLAYTQPLTYAQPVSVMATAAVGGTNCAGASDVSSQSVLTTILPILLPRLIDLFFQRLNDVPVSPPPVSGTVETRLANIEARLSRVEAALNLSNRLGGSMIPDQRIKGIGNKTGDSTYEEILDVLRTMGKNIETIGTQSEQMRKYLLETDEDFRKRIEGK